MPRLRDYGSYEPATHARVLTPMAFHALVATIRAAISSSVNWAATAAYSLESDPSPTSRSMGKLNAGNCAYPNVVISAIRPASIRNTSSFRARYAVSWGRRR